MNSKQMTVVGAVPAGLARHLKSVPAPPVPELARLPRPGERDPIMNGSRSWIIDYDAALPPKERFLFKIQQPGKARGAVFINVSKLRAALRKAEETYTAERAATRG